MIRYTIQSGNTLSALARRFNTTVDALVKANRIANPNLIIAGRTLLVPQGGERPGQSAQAGKTVRGEAAPTHRGGGVAPMSSVGGVPANGKVAVIGDSHTAGTFGATLKTRLQSYLRQGGGKLTQFTGIPSAGVRDFLEGRTTQAGSQTFHTPSLASVLSKKPKQLVVALGTNMLFNSQASNVADIKKLLAAADRAGTRVTWVGPPNVKGYGNSLAGGAPEQRFYDALHQVNAERKAKHRAPITIVDSRKSTKESDTVDGLHFAGEKARVWAREVFKTVAAKAKEALSLTGQMLRRIVPGLTASKADAVAGRLSQAMAEANIKTPLQRSAFVAQLAHESGGFRYLEEIASGRAYEGRRDLGNTQPGDGVRFKGRGYIQLTGRANYAAAGRALGLDLINHPRLAAEPANAARVAAWFWNSRDLNPIAGRGDFREVTRRINGGYNGLADREHYYRLARQVFQA